MLTPSPGSLVVFLLIVAGVVAGFLLGVSRVGDRQEVGRAALGVGLWMGLTAALSASGLLSADWPGPPPLLFFFLLLIGGVAGLSRSDLGRRLALGLPLWALIGFQGFRLPLELVLHRWWVEGVVPVQMTFRGENLDILTGALALLAGLGLWRGYLGRRGAAVVNLIGAALLLNVLRVVLQTADTPLYVPTDEPILTLAEHVPTSWIASVCVAGALVGHVLVFRRLRADHTAGLHRDAA